MDILAADGDTYYSVAVQLWGVDASHSFRVFDYWARNWARFDSKTHVAVLVAESAAGRFRPALEALAEYLPLVVIELRAWRGDAEVILVPDTSQTAIKGERLERVQSDRDHRDKRYLVGRGGSGGDKDCIQYDPRSSGC